jgi:predicted nucleotide-binding protein
MSAQFSQAASSLLARIKAQETNVNQVVRELVPQAKKWIEAGTSLVRTWTGSYCGYHCELYFRDFERPSLRERFSPEWGGIKGIPDGWALRSHEEVKERMQWLAGGVAIEVLEKRTTEMLQPLTALRDDLLIELSPLFRVSGFEKEKQLLGDLENFKWGTKRGEYIHSNLPSQFITRDTEAMNQGIKCPAHLFYEAVAAECSSQCSAAQEFLKLSQRILRPLETETVETAASRGGQKIFIGHGRSLLWLKLRIFLSEKLHLACDEFAEESPAGIATTTRLQSMLDDARFAFLLMTSEDTHVDGTAHARENVVHEAGLFQGRLGFGRAIILLEDGCAEFSNIHGLGQIRFPKDNFDAAFEQIREVLKRERVIS